MGSLEAVKIKVLYRKNDASTQRPLPVYILSIKSSLNDSIPNKL